MMAWWAFAAERPFMATLMLVGGAVWLAFMWTIFCGAIVLAVRGERKRAR